MDARIFCKITQVERLLSGQHSYTGTAQDCQFCTEAFHNGSECISVVNYARERDRAAKIYHRIDINAFTWRSSAGVVSKQVVVAADGVTVFEYVERPAGKFTTIKFDDDRDWQIDISFLALYDVAE